jgi:hypothetical protein
VHASIFVISATPPGLSTFVVSLLPDPIQVWSVHLPCRRPNALRTSFLPYLRLGFGATAIWRLSYKSIPTVVPFFI